MWQARHEHEGVGTNPTGMSMSTTVFFIFPVMSVCYIAKKTSGGITWTPVCTGMAGFSLPWLSGWVVPAGYGCQIPSLVWLSVFCNANHELISSHIRKNVSEMLCSF